MMDCSVAQRKINSFLKGTIKGNELRRFYYHIVDCDECKEVLLDEFSFYTTFNDLDNSLDFNYKNKLKELLNKTKNNIIDSDKSKEMKDVAISVFICFTLVFIVALAVILGSR